MAVTATITRTELGLGSLDLVDASYSILQADGLEPGEVTWRRELVTSPYIAGALEVGAVQDQAKGTVVIRVTGSSASDLQSKISMLISAFQQSEYTFTTRFDGTAWAWTCMRADYSVAMSAVPFRRSFLAKVALSFPRSPVASSGPF